MPIPFLLLGAAVVSVAVGAKKAVEASENFDEAKRVGDQAAENHKRKIEEAKSAHEQTLAALTVLSNLKRKVFNEQIKHLVDTMGKLKKTSSELKDFEGVVIYDDVHTLSGNASFDNQAIEGVLSSAVKVAGISAATSLTSLSAFTPLAGLGGIVLKNSSEKSLTNAYDYERLIGVEIGELEHFIVECKSLVMMAGERFNAIKQMAEVYDSCKSDDVFNAATRQKMVAVGKTLKSMLELRTDDNEAFEKIKISHSGFVRAESSGVGV
jgi:hypothetical protein